MEANVIEQFSTNILSNLAEHNKKTMIFDSLNLPTYSSIDEFARKGTIDEQRASIYSSNFYFSVSFDSEGNTTQATQHYGNGVIGKEEFDRITNLLEISDVSPNSLLEDFKTKLGEHFNKIDTGVQEASFNMMPPILKDLYYVCVYLFTKNVMQDRVPFSLFHFVYYEDSSIPLVKTFVKLNDTQYSINYSF